MKKKKIYDFVFNKDSKGVYAISLVNSGAMQEDFIKLAEDEEIPIQKIDEDEQIVTGIVMKPDKLIYRKDIDGEEAYIKFSKETIKEAAYQFLANGYGNESTLEHEVKVDGVETIESWIVEDATNDKANALGLDVTDGCWVLSQHITDDAIWQSVKDGDYNGFSIEGSFSKVELSTQKPATSELVEIDNILNTIN